MIRHDTRSRRLARIRQKLAVNLGLPRLSIFRSNLHIWAQLIDDKHGKTLLSASTKSVKTKGTKTEKAQAVGQEIAKQAAKLNIKKIRFDRGLYRYHGRVKALANAAREGGLQF